MNFVTVTPVVLRLSDVIQALRVAVAAWGGRRLLAPALVVLLYQRFGEIGRTLERMAARFEAGRLWRRVGRPESVAPGDGDMRRRAVGVRVWPRPFGWLVMAASYEAAGLALQLRALLEMPEMVALLTAAPQAGRVLRPLCRALAVEARLLWPGEERAPVAAAAVSPVVRVRKPRVKVDFGRVPLPRGVLSAARREGFGRG